MIDLRDIDCDAITLSGHKTISKERGNYQTFNLGFEGKYIVIPKVNYTRKEGRKNGQRHSYVEPHAPEQERISLLRKRFHCLAAEGNKVIIFKYKKLTPFHVLCVDQIKYCPTLANNFRVNQCNIVYRFLYVKGRIFTQLLLFGELLPVEVRCEILRQYLALL